MLTYTYYDLYDSFSFSYTLCFFLFGEICLAYVLLKIYFFKNLCDILPSIFANHHSYVSVNKLVTCKNRLTKLTGMIMCNNDATSLRKFRKKKVNLNVINKCNYLIIRRIIPWVMQGPSPGFQILCFRWSKCLFPNLTVDYTNLEFYLNY